ncbi:MAG TPA: Tfp pilus assembly protein FimT/FimU [Janthinobacterium sp.]|jgi:type IV fimbrial biogenesis protein FimT|nr:Tfp pilus assembly protein FimT/FimU [Janthinobacterium sp.]
MSGLRMRGFTLTELMVVLAIAAILAGVALPSFRELIERQRLRTTANDLFAAIDLTRSQAITRGRRVTMMPADPGGSDWSKGWLVFVDKNGNRKADPDEERIFEQGPVAAGISIRYAFSASPAPSYIAYNSAGRSCSATNSLAAHWGTISVLLGKQARHIKINMLGRARICDPHKDADCSGAADS